MMSYVKGGAIGAALLASGCASVELGNDFDPAKFQSTVQRGVTTQADVQSLLGTPTGTGSVVQTSGEQYTRWVYYYGKGRPPKFEHTEFRMLEIQFDDNKRVQGYNWSATPR